MRSDRLGARAGGFTLVEVLIGLALGLVLLAGMGQTLVTLASAARITADHAELAERGRFAIGYLADELRRGWPAPTTAIPEPIGTPCGLPTSERGTAVRIVEPNTFGCLPRNDLIPDTRLLVVDSIAVCDGECSGTSWPAFMLLQPGCHPLFETTEAEVRVVFNGDRPSDCGAETEMALWQRSVFYLRNYSWRSGDDIGALMYKQLKADGTGYTRAEMLIPGLVGWALSVVTPAGYSAPCSDQKSCAGQAAGAGASVELLMTGWERDALAPVFGKLHSGLGVGAVTAGDRARLPIDFVAISDYLQTPLLDPLLQPTDRQ